MEIYAGSLAPEVTQDDVLTAFREFGQVESVVMPADKTTGLPKGFCFVKMPTESEGKAAIAGLNGKEIKGKALVVNEAKPRKPR
jgi:RNA recognition motif-containing protein